MKHISSHLLDKLDDMTLAHLKTLALDNVELQKDPAFEL